MIPRAYIQAWNVRAPWPDLRQVEQDLIICRALCDLFNAPALRDKIGFRGGTAIHKLLFKQPLRYSEDIDLVQTSAEPIGDCRRDTRCLVMARQVQSDASGALDASRVQVRA